MIVIIIRIAVVSIMMLMMITSTLKTNSHMYCYRYYHYSYPDIVIKMSEMQMPWYFCVCLPCSLWYFDAFTDGAMSKVTSTATASRSRRHGCVSP